MSSMAEVVVHEDFSENVEEEVANLSRLERMVLFALITECERCVRCEGEDCFESGKRTSCPFFNIRKIYKINDIEIWKELMK